MPEISILGWFHTLIAIVALISGFYTLSKYHFIQLNRTTGKLYLVCTFLAALTALAIYRHNGFGVAHALAVLTLLALLVGTIAEKTKLFAGFSPYLQATSFSATLLFHMIPAITDGLMRLPVNAPIVSSIEDPLLKNFYLVFLASFVFGLGLQVMLLRKKKAVMVKAGN